MTDFLLAISIPLFIFSFAALATYAFYLHDKLKTLQKVLDAPISTPTPVDTFDNEPDVDGLIPPELRPLLGVVAPPTPKTASNDEIIEILKKSFKETRKNSGGSQK